MYTRPARTANIVLRIAVIVTTTSGLSSDMVNRNWIYSFEDDEVVMETTFIELLVSVLCMVQYGSSNSIVV